MRQRTIVVCFVLLWAMLAAVALLSLLGYLEGRRNGEAIRRLEDRPMILDWGKEVDDAGHRLDKSDGR
jgi:hypothetical protein